MIPRISLALFFVLGIVAAGRADRPNVLFVYADDWGWGDLGCHGHPEIKTPNLDRLASEGTDFHQFTVCNPVCSPSRVAVLTGHFPARYSVHQHFSSHQQNVARGMPDWLDPSVPLLPKIFKQAGYKTAHYGKWHLSGGGVENTPSTSQYGYDDSAVYVGPGKHVFAGTSYGKLARDAAAHDQIAAAYLTTAAVDHTLQFIRSCGETPFYINLWLHETHHLVAATEEDKKAYPETAEPQRTYYSAVTRADLQVGRVLSLLDELGKRDDTIVIFSSDNGPEETHPNPGDKFYYSVGSSGGLRGRKRSLYLGGVGTPLIVRWPGHVPAGRVDKTTTLAAVDFFPTLLAAAGLSAPDRYEADGENVLAALGGQSFQRTKPIFWQWRGTHASTANWPVRAIRDGPWYLLTDDGKNRVELYNVKENREQDRDLSGRYPDRVRSMLSQITVWEATLPDAPPTVTSTPAPTKKPTIDRNAIFDRKDHDKDGLLTLKEYLDRFPDQAEGRRRFPGFDKNGDRQLSRDEFVKPNRP
jgi:N-acetylgalactosamine-6-sulfatase